MPGRALACACQQHGLSVCAEAFVDRAYELIDNELVLVPRSESKALLHDTQEMLDRLEYWQETGEVKTAGGLSCPLAVDTWCVHGDGPLARSVLLSLQKYRGVGISHGEVF